MAAGVRADQLQQRVSGQIRVSARFASRVLLACSRCCFFCSGACVATVNPGVLRALALVKNRGRPVHLVVVRKAHPNGISANRGLPTERLRGAAGGGTEALQAGVNRPGLRPR